MFFEFSEIGESKADSLKKHLTRCNPGLDVEVIKTKRITAVHLLLPFLRGLRMEHFFLCPVFSFCYSLAERKATGTRLHL